VPVNEWLDNLQIAGNPETTTFQDRKAFIFRISYPVVN
jgi:hypothetical protein